MANIFSGNMSIDRKLNCSIDRITPLFISFLCFTLFCFLFDPTTPTQKKTVHKENATKMGPYSTFRSLNCRKKAINGIVIAWKMKIDNKTMQGNEIKRNSLCSLADKTN